MRVQEKSREKETEKETETEQKPRKRLLFSKNNPDLYISSSHCKKKLTYFLPIINHILTHVFNN